MNFMIISMDSLLVNIVIFFLFACFSLNSVPCSASELSYNDHCGFFVPEAKPTEFMSFNFPLGRTKTGYYTGGDKIGLDVFGYQNSFYLETSRIQETDLAGYYKYEASLKFRRRSLYYRVGNSTHAGMSYYSSQNQSYTAAFSLYGFWSESSGKLCMVGTGSGFSAGGNLLNMNAVLKLYNIFTSSNISSYLISGSFESLNSENDVNYFGPISLYMLPRFNYKYTLDTVEAYNECYSGNDSEESSSTVPLEVCSAEVSRELKSLRLEYSSDCNSARNCTPFRGITVYLPSFMSLDEFECSPSRHRLRAVIGFYNDSYDQYKQPLRLNPNKMLIGEGWWDDSKNQLCVVACHFMGMRDPLGSAHVGDCSVRISLRVPSVWSIKDKSDIVGRIWSNKAVNSSGYFNKILFRNDEDPAVTVLGNAGLKYKYSQLERVGKLCPRHKPFMNLGRMYPDAHSSDMAFDISVISSGGQVAQGYASPFTVNDQFFERIIYAASPSYSSYSVLVPEAKKSNNGLFNISYMIIIELLPNFTSSTGNSFLSRFSNPTKTVKISAEGIYDAETGTLCMVGCQNFLSDNGIQFAHSGDCEILVKFQLPPLDTHENVAYMKGSIESTREKSDPLYFNRVELSSRVLYREEVERTFWRVDMEIIIVLISTTLACVFLRLQLYHVKRHPDVLPFISVFMLLILTLGYMVPLVLNFEALFAQNPDKKNVVLGSIGWLEVNEIAVRLMTMVAFLLQWRLLLLTWSARKGDESHKGLWIAERKAFYVTLSLYAAGFLIGLLLKYGDEILFSSAGYSLHQHSSMWEDLKSCGGLLLDGFLLPQIVLNLFMNSRDNAISCSFNFGITFVRLLPHAYDLYRTHSYAFQVNWSYFYADPSADFYSTAWDIAIPLGALLFAVIIFLQQRFGDQCILPCRYRGSQVYEMVPITREAEAEAEKPNNL
ncbi:hypothetical protein L6164_018451 [Bauhinia variegata]|uniref:Uncharacterized protein n=1 Tax=Bauhinia variegata TaxID=167791 RepID=A0ACB9NB04_BAUVA|nr:hypothetical protein L6164_018451 [Bauhinia variegata]